MNLAVWTDISLLWLVFLGVVTILPIAVAFFYAIRGLLRLRQLAEIYLPLTRDRLDLVAARTERASQKIAAPIIGVQTVSAQVKGLSRAVFGRNGR